jgi:dihydrofolate synthase/folylpolyglutamate synthase
MNFEEAVSFLSTLRRFGIKLGNERFERLLLGLGNPHQAGYAIAHIAGTKGKGSTTAMIAAILSAHGLRTGGYYSPYVYDIRERVQVDGEMISQESFAAHMTTIADHVRAMAASEDLQITEFEAKTALGFLHFAYSRVDAAAIEVGMGGRLDATNVVAPAACVITNIGLDHMHILGDTHAKIAFEKAGIIKPGVPLVTAVDHPDALAVVLEAARERHVPVSYVAPRGRSPLSDTTQVSWSVAPDGMQVRTQRQVYSRIRLGLHGDYQAINAATAIAAAEQVLYARDVAICEEAVREGLRTAYVPGRFETVRERPLVILDGAHNELAARALAAEIAKLPRRRLLLVLGMVSGHDPHHVAGPLASLAQRVYVTQPTWQKAFGADALAAVVREYCQDVVTAAPPVEAAVQAMRDADADDLVLISGSFYTLGDIPREVFR